MKPAPGEPVIFAGVTWELHKLELRGFGDSIKHMANIRQYAGAGAARHIVRDMWVNKDDIKPVEETSKEK